MSNDAMTQMISDCRFQISDSRPLLGHERCIHNLKPEIRNPKSNPQSAIRNPQWQGTVLALVLVVVAILSIAAISALFITRSQRSAAAASRLGYQARAAAISGINRAMALLVAEPGNLEARHDNPSIFQAQTLVDGDANGWGFTVWADNLDDPHNVRYGLEDEAAKINLNTATEGMLLALPGMTVELVDCLLDYRDRDSDTRPRGAEQDYYDTLPQPYQIKNGLLATLEELLLVKGFTGGIVYGEDANRNGLLEPNEDDGDASFPPDNGDGQLDRGLRAWCTITTYEPNVSAAGVPRVNIKTADDKKLASAGLAPETVKFIMAARAAKFDLSDPSVLLNASLEVDDPRRPGQKTRLESGVNAGNLAVVMDNCTTGGVPLRGQEVLVGRVNLNTAPRQVLGALPGLNDEDLVQRIIERRQTLEESAKSSTAWIYTQNMVGDAVFKQITPMVTTRSFQFRIRSLGYSLGSGRFCVLEALIDVASGQPRITYQRDLTRLGLPLVVGAAER